MAEEPELGMLPGAGFSRRVALRRQRHRRIALGLGLGLLVGLVPFYIHRQQPSAPPPPPHALPSEWRHARHLIVVAGHAVYMAPSHDASRVRQEGSWYLESYQHGQLDTMLKHIERGVQLAAADNSSLLLFSGGETRRAAGPRSEAMSYWEAADALGWFGSLHVRDRAHLEVQARDSFENLLFAICRFHEISGAYPERITVVSFEFKRWRFEELHRAAVRFPRRRFEYQGIDPPDLSPSVLVGEREHSARPFTYDPYGCRTAGLLDKRSDRNPFRRSVSYPLGCPELSELMAYCGKSIFRDPLPWAEAVDEHDLNTRLRSE
ncbi:hypothetical protein AB1Y20_020439 [Prymnesium parvum]|uniref:DUF218 domain-containing protein n=1 Tax=Prymnesium parvum TaxID=97485 RepID=A0AB34JUL2_PRYPA